MRFLKLPVISILFFLASILAVNAQNLTPAQKEYEKNKVQIFTVNERDNLLNWFTDRSKLMGLSEDKEDEYSGILIFYFVKMGRLDDKDQGNSKEEILQKMDILLKKQDVEIKALLPEDEYDIHQKNYDEFIKIIKKRIIETDL